MTYFVVHVNYFVENVSLVQIYSNQCSLFSAGCTSGVAFHFENKSIYTPLARSASLNNVANPTEAFKPRRNSVPVYNLIGYIQLRVINLGDFG